MLNVSFQVKPHVGMLVGEWTKSVCTFLKHEGRKGNKGTNYDVIFDREYLYRYIDLKIIKPLYTSTFTFVMKAVLEAIKYEHGYIFPIKYTHANEPCITLKDMGLDDSYFKLKDNG